MFTRKAQIVAGDSLQLITREHSANQWSHVAATADAKTGKPVARSN
jgi:hypothetical protein